MATLFDKLRVAVLSHAHDLLDADIDWNSPSKLRQYVRDMEASLDGLQAQAATQAGQVRTLEREYKDTLALIDTDKGIIQKLIAGGREDLAKTKAAEVIDLQHKADSLSQQLSESRISSADLDKTVATIDGQHRKALAKLRDLENLDRTTKWKEAAAANVAAATKHLNSGGVDNSVDNIEQRMRERNDVATEKLNRAMGATPQPEADPLRDEAVNDLLNSLRPTAAATK